MVEPLCISIRHAISGELLCELAGSEVGELRVWELRLQFCQEQETLPFFGWIFLHEERVLDDAALVAEYREDPLSGSILHALCLGPETAPADTGRSTGH